MSLVNLLQRLRHSVSTDVTLPNEALSAAVVQVLRDNRLLGEILLQLPRQVKPSLAGVMGLGWQDNELVLMVNPHKLARIRTDELKFLLEHEALHIVWQHPLRYANHRHPQMVKVATDVAVNQYLAQAPQGTVTLDQLQRLLRRRIPTKLDSQEYLNLLEKLSPEEQERLRHTGLHLEGDAHGEAAHRGQREPQDIHDGWKISKLGSQENSDNQLIRLAKISQLLKHAWHETPQRNRGLLPGEVQQQIEKSTQTRKISWQRVLQRQLGLLAHGQRESHARFNRRQPLRMDLPGKITRLTPQVNVFIDNSGSVTDEELSQTLLTIEKMVSRKRLTINLYSFDAKVTAQKKLRPGQHIRFARHGGGGTSFQCVFDYLHDHHISQQASLTIIITDGWGEKSLRNYHYHNVCWLLMTSIDQLSVKDAPGRVLEMKGKANDDNS